jgi:hypothetical protein
MTRLGNAAPSAPSAFPAVPLAAVFSAAGVLAGAALALPGPALAEAGLAGTWSSIEGREGVRAGEAHHDVSDGEAFIDDSDETWTLTIEETRGDAFRAEWCSPKQCEEALGVVGADGTLQAVDEDGIFRGTLLGEVMELCYLEPGKDFRVVDCHMLGRR